MAPDPVLVANTAAWLRKAGQDLKRVERCMSAESPDVEDAVFHRQQAAEKALKAFLTWHDEPFRRTHDLAALGQQCAVIDPTLGLLANQLDDLTEYGWVYRYPTNLSEPSPPEVDEASGLAYDIVSEIGKRMPAQVRVAAGQVAGGSDPEPAK